MTETSLFFKNLLKTATYAIVGTVIATSLASVSANATILIDTGASSSSQAWNVGSYVTGTEFTTSTSLSVSALGWLDAEGDGLSGSHAVSLWSVASQTRLATVTVTPGSATILSAQGTAQWFMENITPLIISAGTYRIAGTIDSDTTRLINPDSPYGFGLYPERSSFNIVESVT